jgi:uncharacterized protein DUF4239
VQQFLLVNVPGLALAVLFVVVAVGLSVGGLLLVRRSVALSTLERHNDVAGFIIAVVGVLYAVLLAFVVVVTWQDFGNAQEVATNEAQEVAGLYRDASVFGAQGVAVQHALEEYARSVINQEWLAMSAHQHESRATEERLNEVWRAYHEIRPTGEREQTFYSESIRRLNELDSTRDDRLNAATASLPGVLWGVLIAGAIITIGFTYFFGLSNLWANVLMVTALAAMVGLTLFLIFSLDLPYSGDLAVDQSAMRHVVTELHHFQVGVGR